jgi:hypothetical protein
MEVTSIQKNGTTTVSQLVHIDWSIITDAAGNIKSYQGNIINGTRSVGYLNSRDNDSVVISLSSGNGLTPAERAAVFSACATDATTDTTTAQTQA